MAKEIITCEICNAEIHAVKAHLQKQHGSDSDTPCTYDEYRQMFPKAPLLSELVKERLRQVKADTKKQAKSSMGINTDVQTRPLHEVFRLGDNPEARRRTDNGDIPVTVCRHEGFEELIPEYNEAFVYNIDTLKSALACFETNEPLYLYGHSGLGKSSLFKQICSATRRRYVRFQHNFDSQVSQAVGQWVVNTKVDDNGNTVSFTEWQWGPLALAMIHGWTYNADEIDRAPPGFNSTYQSVLEGEPLFVPEAPPEQRIIKPHPDFRFVATGNSNGCGDETGLYGATMQQDAATVERFVVLQVSYLKPDDEVTMLVGGTNLMRPQAEKLVEFSNSIRSRFPEDFDLTIGPRVMLRAAKMSVIRGCWETGIAMAFANRLPEDQRKSALDVAQRYFGS